MLKTYLKHFLTSDVRHWFGLICQQPTHNNHPHLRWRFNDIPVWSKHQQHVCDHIPAGVWRIKWQLWHIESPIQVLCLNRKIWRRIVYIEKRAVSVLIKRFVNGNERCHTIDAQRRMNIALFYTKTTYNLWSHKDQRNNYTLIRKEQQEMCCSFFGLLRAFGMNVRRHPCPLAI